MSVLKTPKGFRIHIGIFGRRNVGKSSLLNALVGQSISIVSPTPGTTTDPVEKAMELQPIGPVVFIDTAGVDLKYLAVEIMYRYDENNYKIIKMNVGNREKNTVDFKGELKIEASGKQSINIRIRPVFENLKSIPMIKWYFNTEDK